VLAEGTLSPAEGLKVLQDDARGEEVALFRAVYGDVVRQRNTAQGGAA
jgi:hypothetical protein